MGKRGLLPSDEKIIKGMNNEVNKFIDFVILKVKNGKTKEILTDEIQQYVDDADFWEEYDTEEKEWIFDAFCPIIERVGVN